MTRAIALAPCLLMALTAAAGMPDCAKDVQSVDQALAALPDTERDDAARAEELRDRGALLCQSGQRAEAEAVLLLAKAILGIT